MTRFAQPDWVRPTKYHIKQTANHRGATALICIGVAIGVRTVQAIFGNSGYMETAICLGLISILLGRQGNNPNQSELTESVSIWLGWGALAYFGRSLGFEPATIWLYWAWILMGCLGYWRAIKRGIRDS